MAEPAWSDVQLLISADGPNGSTALVDESSYHRTVTCFANAAITTAVKKYGTGSIGFDGSGDKVTIGDASDWTWMHGPTAKWTFEYFGTITSFIAENTIFSTSNGSTANNGIFLAVDASTRKVDFQIYRGVPTTLALNGVFATALPNDSAYHHIVIQLDAGAASNNARLMVDGVAFGTINNTGNSYSTGAATTTLTLGAWSTNADYKGTMDEIRLSKDTLVYTAPFTPPTRQFNRTVEADGAMAAVGAATWVSPKIGAASLSGAGAAAWDGKRTAAAVAAAHATGALAGAGSGISMSTMASSAVGSFSVTAIPPSVASMAGVSTITFSGESTARSFGHLQGIGSMVGAYRLATVFPVSMSPVEFGTPIGPNNKPRKVLMSIDAVQFGIPVALRIRP